MLFFLDWNFTNPYSLSDRKPYATVRMKRKFILDQRRYYTDVRKNTRSSKAKQKLIRRKTIYSHILPAIARPFEGGKHRTATVGQPAYTYRGEKQHPEPPASRVSFPFRQRSGSWLVGNRFPDSRDNGPHFLDVCLVKVGTKKNFSLPNHFCHRYTNTDGGGVEQKNKKQ